MIKIESADGVRRNPHVKPECEDCTLAGQMQANCGWCEHLDYIHSGYDDSYNHVRVCKLKICNFTPWRGFEDCYRICGVDFDGRRP